MSVLFDAFELTTKAAKWADGIRMNALTENEFKDNETVILLRNSTEEIAIYGNNKVQSIVKTVQVQIFYSLTADIGDFDDLEIALIKAYENANWSIKAIRGRIPDPDSKQLTQTILITKTKEV